MAEENHELGLLVFQNLGTFLGLKNAYDSSQVKAFYCVAERQPDNFSFVCPFKNCVATLTPGIWASIAGLECVGVDIESENLFAGYDKVSFVQSISKTCIVPLEYSNFNAIQLECDDRILHLIIAKMIICKQDHFGRIDNFDLQVMWLIKNRIKVNWPLFLCNRMITYKLDISKKMPFPSFLGLVLKEKGIMTSDPLLTKPNPMSGLDNDVVNKMHYYQDSRNEWFYSDGGVWYYDDIPVPANIEPELVDEMRANLNHEDAGLDGDAEMEEAEDDNDSDYEPEVPEVQHGPDMTQVLASISDLKSFMTQQFNDQDTQFQEIHHRFDSQETQFNEMKDQFHKWNTSLGVSTDDFFHDNGDAAGSLDLGNDAQ